MPSRTGEKPYKCDHCSYACTRQSYLTIHMRTHTGEKPYKCDHCSYACTSQSSLTIHMRTHTGEKPYKCDHCSYACTSRSTLTTHLRTHTGEKPYKCNHCPFASAKQTHLKRHMRTHTDVDTDRSAKDDNPEMQNNLSEPVIESKTVAKSVMSDSDYLLPFETCLPENGIDFNESLELLYAHPGMKDSINDNFCDIEHAKDNVFGFDTEEEGEEANGDGHHDDSMKMEVAT